MRTLPSEPWKRGEQTACARCRPLGLISLRRALPALCLRLPEGGGTASLGWPAMSASSSQACLPLQGCGRGRGPGQSTEGDSSPPQDCAGGLHRRLFHPPSQEGDPYGDPVFLLPLGIRSAQGYVEVKARAQLLPVVRQPCGLSGRNPRWTEDRSSWDRTSLHLVRGCPPAILG